MKTIPARLSLIVFGAPAALVLLANSPLAKAETAPGDEKLEAAPEGGSFTSENDAAMIKMMKEMHVAPTGDADRDFLLMMIPHHQGAVDMARAQIRYGNNPQLKEFSGRIIAAQEAEIAYMRDMLSDTPASGVPLDHEMHNHHVSAQRNPPSKTEP